MIELYGKEKKLESSSSYFNSSKWKITKKSTCYIPSKEIVKEPLLIKNKFIYLYDEGLRLRFNRELEHIINSIKGSINLLKLKEDWDDEGALPIKHETWERAANFLCNYSNGIFVNFGIIVEAPSINPGPDSSIDLVWRTKHFRLLVNIPEDASQQVGYYGDNYKDSNSIKGRVPLNEYVEYLGVWMKNLTV